MKQEFLKIGKREYLINSWKTSVQLRNLPKIGKAFAVPVMMLLQGGEDNIETAIPQALYMLFEQMEEQDIESLFKTILSEVYVNDVIANMDKDFDDLDELLQVASKVLEMNYSKLFTGNGLAAFSQKMMPLTQQAQG